MGLFDAFSASDETRNFQQGTQSYNKYANAADAKAQLGVNAISDAKPEGLGYLDWGAKYATDNLSKAIPLWQQLSGQGQQGIDAHFNLLQNPDSVFDSELYKSRENAGIEGINRVANSRGMLASGNNTQDILDYMRTGGLDYFNTLLNGYSPYFSLAQGAAQGLTGVYGGLGQIASDLATGKANIATGTASNLANQYNRQGDIALSKGQVANDAYTNTANAQSAADSNLWSAILGLASAASGGVGSYVGAGGKF